ncbi:hypothetical protein B0H14DRAFT_3467285 [Mycena olivaceomarginata]|nr:hypothetical protein B0H14DRAFT_3467285 [Mycena olivaceomarginata]
MARNHVVRCHLKIYAKRVINVIISSLSAPTEAEHKVFRTRKRTPRSNSAKGQATQPPIYPYTLGGNKWSTSPLSPLYEDPNAAMLLAGARNPNVTRRHDAHTHSRLRMVANLAQKRTSAPPGLPLAARQTPNSITCDNPHNGTPVKTRRIEQGVRQLLQPRPPTFPIAEGPRSRPQILSPSGSFASGDIDADPFAPTYTLAHALPSALITSSATPLTTSRRNPHTPRAATNALLPDELPASATSPPPPGSRSVSPAPASPALSDDDMDEDTNNTPRLRQSRERPGLRRPHPHLPCRKSHKPYRGFVASGPEDHAGVPFQKHSGGGAGLVMSHNTAMTNVQPRVVDFIAEDPDSFILFIPFLGGAHFNKKYRDAASDLTKHLEQITGAGGIEIYPPTPHEKGDFAGHVMYHPPWVLVGKCTSKEVRDELARHQLIACSRDLAVHVLKVDLLRKSWLLGHWRCNTLVPISPAVLRAAVAIATFSQGPIRTAIVHATQNEDGTADERVYRFVQTLDPCSESHAVWESIRDLFRNTSFTKGLSEFTPIGSPSRSAGSTIRRLALCYICKLDDHRSDTCLYALLPDWLGPNEVIKEGREGILALTPGKPQARTTAQGTPVTGDGGYSAPGGHALNDRPEEEGDFAMGGAEDLTYRDEPERASGMRELMTHLVPHPVRGEKSHTVRSCKHLRGPCNEAPSERTNTLKAQNALQVRGHPPRRQYNLPFATENAATSAQTAESENIELSQNSTPIREAMNQYLDYLAGGAMLPPILQPQEPQEDAEMLPTRT